MASSSALDRLSYGVSFASEYWSQAVAKVKECDGEIVRHEVPNLNELCPSLEGIDQLRVNLIRSGARMAIDRGVMKIDEGFFGADLRAVLQAFYSDLEAEEVLAAMQSRIDELNQRKIGIRNQMFALGGVLGSLLFVDSADRSSQALLMEWLTELITVFGLSGAAAAVGGYWLERRQDRLVTAKRDNVDQEVLQTGLCLNAILIQAGAFVADSPDEVCKQRVFIEMAKMMSSRLRDKVFALQCAEMENAGVRLER